MRPSPRPAQGLVRRALRTLITLVLVPILLFEEWGWAPLAALVGRLARLPLWHRVEEAIRRLPPQGALLLFLVPVLLLLPVKLLGLWLLGIGHPLSAMGVIVGAKLAGTALVARLFQLVEPALMRLAWFARWYPRWKAWKDGVLRQVRQSAPWRACRSRSLGLRRWWRGLRRRRAAAGVGR